MFGGGLISSALCSGGISGGGGGGDEWQPPDWWIPVPEPGPNEVYLLAEATPNHNKVYIRMGELEYGDVLPSYEDDTIIDFGDGTVTKYANGSTYTYQEPGQYLIKITTTKAPVFQGMGTADVGYILLVVKLGSNIRIYPENGDRGIRTFQEQTRLQYIKINNPNVEYLPRQFAYNCPCLYQVYTAGKIKAVRETCFFNCYNLSKIDLTEVEMIETSSLYQTNLKKVDIPKCTTIGSSAFYGNYNLKAINAPLCETVGDSAFYYNYALEKVAFAENCTFGSNCFFNCYSLNPRPDGSTI